jgi:hypothetical protein
MKQVTLAMAMYAQDYDERYPANKNNCSHGPFDSWDQVSGQGVDDFHMQAFFYAALVQPYIKNIQIFKCPSAPDNIWKDWFSGGGAVTRIQQLMPGIKGIDYEWKLAYALASRCGRGLAAYNLPAQTVQIIEGWNTGAPHDGENQWTGHIKSGNNVGFNDTHVKYQRMSAHKQRTCDGNRVDIDLHWGVHISDCGWDWDPNNTVDWQ